MLSLVRSPPVGAVPQSQPRLLVLFVSLVGYGLCSRGVHLLTLLLCLQCTHAAFVLVLLAGKSGLTLLLPRGLASEPGVEASTAKPQEDGTGGRHLPCKSEVFSRKA